MANRYCGNCGNELSQDTRFCPSCGRPLHETAQISTAEANVDVPSPPQSQGGKTGALQGSQTGSQRRRHTILMGGLGIVAILFLIGVVGAILGGGQETVSGGGEA